MMRRHEAEKDTRNDGSKESLSLSLLWQVSSKAAGERASLSTQVSARDRMPWS